MGGAVAVGIKYPNTASTPKETFRNEPIQEYQEPKVARLTKSERTHALTAALNFVNSAVARKHLEDSWALAGPDLRRGLTKAQWSTGEIPVVPYPAAEARVRVEYSYRNEVGLRMLLLPPSASKLQPMTFDMDLKAFGSGGNRRWLVNAFTPTGVTSIPVAPGAADEGRAMGGGGLAPNTEGLDAPLSATWIFVPIGALLLVLLIPVGLGVRSWLQGRRAYREYEKTRRAVPPGTS